MWIGWLYCLRRQRWERVTQGESLSECSRKLGVIVDARGTKDKFSVMTGGAMPTFRPATNARERAGGTGVETWEYAYLGSPASPCSPYGRTGQDEIDTENRIPQKNGQTRDLRQPHNHPRGE
jgi:hypothetical protein